MKNHVILINHAKGQIETHEVDADKFLEVYDLLHPDHSRIVEGLSFGAAQRVPEVLAAVRGSIDENPERHPASDPLADIPALADAMANSTDDDPELEDEPAPVVTPRPVNSDKAFADSLAALFT